jgi:hypothetical protein
MIFLPGAIFLKAKLLREKLTTDFHLVPRSGIVKLCLNSTYAFMWWCRIDKVGIRVSLPIYRLAEKGILQMYFFCQHITLIIHC